MTSAPSRWWGFDLRIGARAAVVTCAYLAASVLVLAVILVLRRLVSPALLQGVLGFFFIASLAAGLEPATVKAAALRQVTGSAPSSVGIGAYLAAGALKAIVAAPFLALVWRFADPHVEIGALLWLPLVCMAGFAATDLRVLFDLEGRYGLAIGLKQGSLAGGLAILAVLVAAHVPLVWAIGLSTLARLGLVGVVLLASPRRGDGRGLWRDIRGLIADARWVELAAASVIGAIGGSTDRVVGLRYLAPALYSGYYLLYEVLSKFWLIPYVLAPIIFARRATLDAGDPFIGRAWRLTGLAGLAFLAAAAGLLFLSPGLVDRFVGAAFGPAILAFAAAVVINSFSQLKIAELQGAGLARRAAVAVGAGAVIATALFFILARQFGVGGLLVAWLGKSVAELALLMAAGRRRPR